MEDLISVIVPVYNADKTLGACVESILKSTYNKIEIIIVDDGSRMETAKVCDYIQTFDQRITVYHIENSGVSFARNVGIENSNGKYIMFVDADDTISNDAIEVLHRLCVEYSADFSICGYTEYYKDGDFKKVYNSNKINVWDKEQLRHEFFVNDSIGWNVWAKMYKRSTIERVRFPVGMRIAEDMYFVYQTCMNSERVVQKEVALYNYIKNDNSAMADCDCEKFFDSYTLLNNVLHDDTYFLSEGLYYEKMQFFIKHTLWFLRFIIVRDHKNIYTCKVRDIRKELIKCVREYDCTKMKIQQQIEIVLLRYAYPVFKLYALIKAYKRN